jgi:hypothetical protein
MRQPLSNANAASAAGTLSRRALTQLHKFAARNAMAPPKAGTKSGNWYQLIES